MQRHRPQRRYMVDDMRDEEEPKPQPRYSYRDELRFITNLGTYGRDTPSRVRDVSILRRRRLLEGYLKSLDTRVMMPTGANHEMLYAAARSALLRLG